MDLDGIKKLLLFPRPSDEYLAGIDGFLEFAYKEKNLDDKIRCPCKKCVNKWLLIRDKVYDHLVCNGMLLGYSPWGCHGETSSFIAANNEQESHNRMDKNMHQHVQDAFGNTDNAPIGNNYDAPNTSNSGPDSETKAFYDLLQGAHEPLWEGSILQQAIQNGKSLPRTFAEVKKIIGKLGLNYVKLHACPKNCQLYQKDKANDDFCLKCGTSRLKNTKEKITLTNKERRSATPRKVLQYFPIKPRFKRELSAKVLHLDVIEKLEELIKMTLCHMEMVFPREFSTIMVHLIVHLATEAKIGPVCYRSMYFVERYLCVLKSYVRNKALPKGYIAEAYLKDECMTFCSRYLEGFDTKHNQPSRNDDKEELIASLDEEQQLSLFPHAEKHLGKPRKCMPTRLGKTYRQGRVTPKIIERTQNEKFHEWFRAHEEWTVDIEFEPSHVSQLGVMFNDANSCQQWVRTDVEGTIVDANNGAFNNKS
uniref:Transposase-associated domain-containing protein n=1 Tax=Oryza brachyantha TaxID=4533 RepID=J3NCZ7_ORYBR